MNALDWQTVIALLCVGCALLALMKRAMRLVSGSGRAGCGRDSCDCADQSARHKEVVELQVSKRK